MRPDFFRWIGLFPLDVWHLPERMFFAGYAKEKRAERNSDDAMAEEASHNEPPQLSVSGVARKDESALSHLAHRPHGTHKANETDKS